MDEMKIERAEMADAQDVYALYHSLIDAEYSTWSEEYPSQELVFDDVGRNKTLIIRTNDGDIAAAIALLSAEDEPEFDDAGAWYDDVKKWAVPARLGVAAAYQGKGLARKMLAAAMDDARRDGCDGIRFLVAKRNIIAQRAYAPFGFDVCGECELWCDRWLCYQKRL